MGDYIANFLRVSIPSIVSGVGDSIGLIILEEEVISRSNANEDQSQRGERTGHTKTVERFVFNFQMSDIIGCKVEAKVEQKPSRLSTDPMDIEDLQQIAIKHDNEVLAEARSQLERYMREILLRVLTLRKRRRRTGEKAENMSFKLCLHVPEEKKKQQHDTTTETKDTLEASQKGRETTCPELMKALQQGVWHMPEQSSCLFPTNSNDDNSTSHKQNGTKGLLRPLKDISIPSCGMRVQLGMEVDPT